MRRPAAALMVALLGILPGVAACAGSSKKDQATPTTDTAPASTTTTEVPLSGGRQFTFYVPSVGDCYDVRQPPEGAPIYLKLGCDLPHEHEVFGVLEVSAKDYPGPAPLETQAKLECPPLFAAYVGAPYETSELEMSYLYPTAGSWGIGTRHVIGCLVVPAGGGRTTGSFRDAKR